MLCLLLSNAGCSHDLYQPLPFQTVRLEQDVQAKVSFPIRMPDNSIQTVQATVTLGKGWEAKQLTADEQSRLQKILSTRPVNTTNPAIQPGKSP